MPAGLQFVKIHLKLWHSLSASQFKIPTKNISQTNSNLFSKHYQ